jgi:hypothetical protein
MSTFCSYCYKQQSEEVTLKLCSKCHHRMFCSRECQVADWKNGHKHWCNKAGEIGFDYEVRESPGKGVGIFSLRCFKRGDKIMAERAINDSESSPDVVNAIHQLMPDEISDLQAKFDLNSIGTGDRESAGSCLFITMARVNHACNGNTTHFYISEHEVKILVASRDIEAGEEITFSYIDRIRHPAHYPLLNVKWGIDCQCTFCLDPMMAKKLLIIHKLDSDIMSLGSRRDFQGGLDSANRLLQYYDELHEGPDLYARTYYEMYQLAITSTRTMRRAKIYISSALENAILYYGDENIAEVPQYRDFCRNPSSHRNYMLGESR